jgi:hypothetical protein
VKEYAGLIYRVLAEADVVRRRRQVKELLSCQ